MDEARILPRLERIDALDRSGASSGALLAELRALVREAEAEAPAEQQTGSDGEEVVGRRRTARHGT